MNKVIQGDSLNILKNGTSESIDLIITDPPYGMSFQSNHRKEKHLKIENDNTLEWLDDFVQQAYRVLKNNTHFYCFCSWHHIDTFKQSIQKYFEVKNILVWVKNNTGMGDLYGDYAPKHEFIIYARKGKRKLNGRRDSNILEYKRTGNKLHPTEKPIKLYDWILQNYAKPNDLILDTHLGSGSSRIAAYKGGFNFVGFEINEHYYEKQEKRFNDFKSQLRLF